MSKLKNNSFVARLLVGLVFLVICGMLGIIVSGTNNTSATSITISTGDEPTLEVNLSSNTVNLDLTPNPNTPAFSTTSLTVTAGTNNFTGYTAYLEIADQNLSRTEPLANGTTPAINSLATNENGYTEDTFTTNSWGYKITGNNFLSIPTGEQLLSSSTEPVNQNSTTITFASKVDFNIPSGTYTTDITIRAITNSPPPTMQDIDTWRGSLVPEQRILAKDTRDGKYYYVTKIGDKIWMTRNLDIAGGTTLTPADSNVSSNYTLPASETMGSNGKLANSNAFSDSSKAYVYNDNTYGGYYSYAAVTAGTNPSSGNASSDICPKGWRLPTKDEYTTLRNTYTAGNTLTAAPWYGAYGGVYGDGSALVVGSEGHYWSSTANNSTNDSKNAYYLYVTSGYVVTYDNLKDRGRSARCLAKNPDTIVTYDANGGTGTMANQNLGEFDGTLTTNTFTRDGYVFTGWNTKADGSGTPYSNSATYSGPSTTLYAQWAPITFDIAFANAGKSKVAVDSNQYYKMQDISTTICNAVGQNQSGQLVDTRDNAIYNVGKLADGKCWMLDNLALDLTNSTVLNNMTPSNTNASTTSLTSLRSGNRSAGNQYATAGVSNWTSGLSYSAPLVNLTNKDVVPNNAPTNSKGNNKVGGYYNYCAASAGSYCYGNGASRGTSSGDATEDICPAGWRMPTGDTTGEYSALANAIYGSTGSTTDTTKVANYRTALSLPLSGYFNVGSVYYQGSSGDFWSSTRLDEYGMYNLRVGTGAVYPADANDLNNGLSVRCITR